MGPKPHEIKNIADLQLAFTTKSSILIWPSRQKHFQVQYLHLALTLSMIGGSSTSAVFTYKENTVHTFDPSANLYPV